MKSHFYHLQINISFKNLHFYRELMEFLGWSVIFENKNIIGFQNGDRGHIWFGRTDDTNEVDYNKKGMNHLAIKVETLKDVDAIVEYLNKKKILPLFQTPRHRPEFVGKETHTYYQVMFESPDKILFEIAYIGPKF